MKKKHLWIKLSAAALAITAILGVTAVASGVNTASDPLITLSYLTGTYKTNLLSEVDTAVAAKQRQLSQEFSKQAEALKAGIAAPAPAPVENDFEAVTLSAGQSVSLPAGGEALMLSGSAEAGAAGLTDTTAGSAVLSGGALTVNHLYVAADACTIRASGSAKLLIKG